MRPKLWTQYEQLMIDVYNAGWSAEDIRKIILSTYGENVPKGTIKHRLRTLGVRMRPRGNQPGQVKRPQTKRSRTITNLIVYMYFVMDKLPIEIVQAMRETFPEVRNSQAVQRRIRKAGYQLYSQSQQMEKAKKRGFCERKGGNHGSVSSFISREEATKAGLPYVRGMRRRDLAAAVQNTTSSEVTIEVRTNETRTSNLDQ